MQKLLSAAGVASRRASEQMILEGRVTVNGETVRELGTKADPAKDAIKVDGRRIKTDITHRYIVLYKPKGYVTTRSDPEGRRTVMDLIGEGAYIYPVGRLDYDSEGLLLMMTDGDLAAGLMHPRHEVDKVYEVIVAGAPDSRALDKLRKGVFIEGGRTSPAAVHVGTTVKGQQAHHQTDHHDPRRPQPANSKHVQRRGPAGAGLAARPHGADWAGPPETRAVARSHDR